MGLIAHMARHESPIARKTRLYGIDSLLRVLFDGPRWPPIVRLNRLWVDKDHSAARIST